MSWLEKLRNKSQSEKKKLLWIVMGITSVIVFLVWLTAIPKDYLNKEGEKKEHLADLQGAIQGTFSGQEFDELQDSVDKLKNIDGEMIGLEETLDKSADDSQLDTQPEDTDIKPKNRLPLEEQRD